VTQIPDIVTFSSQYRDYFVQLQLKIVFLSIIYLTDFHLVAKIYLCILSIFMDPI